MDWAKAVDVDQALANVNTDLYGDWFNLDPPF